MSPEKPMTPPERFVSFSGVVFKIIPGLEDFPETETSGWSMSATRRANPSTRCVLTSMATAWHGLATARGKGEHFNLGHDKGGD
jgi:hypothetical protein